MKKMMMKLAAIAVMAVIGTTTAQAQAVVTDPAQQTALQKEKEKAQKEALKARQKAEKEQAKAQKEAKKAEKEAKAREKAAKKKQKEIEKREKANQAAKKAARDAEKAQEKAAKAAAAKKNEGSRERGGNRDSRGGRGGNGRREGSFEHRNNAGGRSSQPHGARNAAASMPAPSEGRPSRKGQDNRRNGEHSEYKRDKRKGSRLDKSERTFTLEKQSAHKKQHKQPQPKPHLPRRNRSLRLPRLK